MKPHHGPDYEAAPVMATKNGLVDFELVEHPRHVVAEHAEVILFEGLGTVREAVAPLVGCEDTVASLAERLDLAPPREGQLGEAMAEDNRRAFAFLIDGHADAVRLNRFRLGHHRRRPNLRVLGGTPARGNHGSQAGDNRRL